MVRLFDKRTQTIYNDKHVIVHCFLVVSGCISVITYVYIIIIKLVFKVTDVKLA